MLCRNVIAIDKMTPTILNCKNLPQINQYQVQKAVCVFELVRNKKLCYFDYFNAQINDKTSPRSTNNLHR